MSGYSINMSVLYHNKEVTLVGNAKDGKINIRYKAYGKEHTVNANQITPIPHMKDYKNYKIEWNNRFNTELESDKQRADRLEVEVIVLKAKLNIANKVPLPLQKEVIKTFPEDQKKELHFRISYNRRYMLLRHYETGELIIIFENETNSVGHSDLVRDFEQKYSKDYQGVAGGFYISSGHNDIDNNYVLFFGASQSYRMPEEKELIEAVNDYNRRFINERIKQYPDQEISYWDKWKIIPIIKGKNYNPITGIDELKTNE